ncbi:MAG: hypothetical protein CME61_05560 [Halobacteriovoraceae bacterium]|nr:hypothetical protein [Halobacteriovoraceae bacterium]
MQSHKSRTYVYVFIGAGVLFFLSSLIMAMYQNKVFDSRSSFYFEVESAAGLSSRPAVTFKGVEIGAVESFSLGEKVRVEFFVYDEYFKYLSFYELIFLKRNPLTGDIIEVELINDPINKEIYKQKISKKFLTTEDESITESINAGSIVGRQGVGSLLIQVSDLINLIQEKKLVQKLDNALEFTNTISKKIDAELLSEDPGENIKLIKKSFSEVNSLLVGLNQSNKLLYNILEEVEKNKDKIGPIITSGEDTLLKGGLLIEGIQQNSFIGPMVSPPKKDLKNGAFLE